MINTSSSDGALGPESALKILIVEDDVDQARIADLTLRKSTEVGYFESAHVTTLAEAVRQVRTEDFDCILLDLGLPDAQGLDVIVGMVSAAGVVPIIVLTANRDPEMGLQAIGLGVQDFICKSDFQGTALARTIRYVIERVARQASDRALADSRAEYRIAAEIQTGLLQERLNVHENIEVAAKCLRSDRPSGDLYGVPQSFDESVIGYLADVCGQGIPAAIIASVISGFFRGSCTLDRDLKEIATHLDQLLGESLKRPKFVTCFLFEHDLQAEQLSYVAAGHRAYLLNQQGEAQTLGPNCTPLGLPSKSQPIIQASVPCKHDDLLVIPSDGITEARNLKQEAFGSERLLDTIRENRNASLQQIIDRVFSELGKFVGEESIEDDCTLVLCRSQS